MDFVNPYAPSPQRRRALIKVLLMMRFITAFLLAACLQVSAKGYGQITLSVTNGSLNEVFREIQQQSGADIVYSYEQLEKIGAVSVHLKNVSLSEALTASLKNKPLNFEIRNGIVIIRRNQPTTVKTPSSDSILVRGRVINERGEAVNAAITVKGTRQGAFTDEKGDFSIMTVANDAKLQISGVNFEMIELTVNGKGDLGVITVRMKITALEDVVVNAGYYKVSEKERTGSISRITSKEMATQPVSNVLAAMQGRMAGVDIVQTTGTPGGGFAIQIRGQNSLRVDGNTPLYVIDGVPYAAESLGNSNTSTTLQGTLNPLNSINPRDVESIEILKDADATAIYGSRGANGVVLITTRKGRVGKTAFTANLSSGIGEVPRLMKLMNTRQYLQMRKQAFENDGITTYPAAAYDINGVWDQDRYTNWQEELVGGASTYNDMQGTLSGGSLQTQFLLSGYYHRETTVFPGDFNYKKGGFRANINHISENERFKAVFSAGYNTQRNLLPGLDLTRLAFQLAPNAPALYQPDGSLNWENDTWTNPLSNLEGKYIASTQDVLANMLLSYKLLPELEWKTSLGFSNTRSEESRTLPSTMYNPSWMVGSEFSTLYLNTANRSSWIIEPQLEWSHQIGKGRLQLLVGSTFQQQLSSQLVHEADGFSSNALIYNLSAASLLFILRDVEAKYRYHAFFTRLNYNFDKRYYINLTGRRDGSSRFGTDRQFANFGAIGAAWILSNEQFFKERLPGISFAKIRASYGITGNDQIGDYQFLDSYTPAGSNYGGTVGIEPTRLYNPNFGWESSTKLELAAEMGMLQNRVILTAGWYSNRSSNQLVGLPLSAVTGFTSLQANLDAVVGNAGVELTLSTVNIDRRSFKWTTNLNLTRSRNKLIAYPGLESSSYKNQYIVGKPLNILKVYRYTGIDPQTGVYTFEDFNGDGQITSIEDRQVVNDFTPDFFGGVSNQFTYKNWQLDFLFQFVRRDNYNAESRSGLPGGMNNQPAYLDNAWGVNNPAAPFQIYSAGYNNLAAVAYSNYTSSDAAVTDASYIRLKNIALSYNLPQKTGFLSNGKISLEAQNLLTITGYKGIDPEFSIVGYLPPLRVITARFQFTF